ncbi:hypothetical protein ACLOJK_037384 [Asimina triloba]
MTPSTKFRQLPSCPTLTTTALRHDAFNKEEDDTVIILVDTHHRRAPRRAIQATHHTGDDEHNSDPSRPHTNGVYSSHPRRTRPLCRRRTHHLLPIQPSIFTCACADRHRHRYCRLRRHRRRLCITRHPPASAAVDPITCRQQRLHRPVPPIDDPLRLHRPLRRPSTIISACITAVVRLRLRTTPPEVAAIATVRSITCTPLPTIARRRSC